MLIKAVDVRVFVHATEDESKVKHALRNVIGDTHLIEEHYDGYYGNKIIIISAYVEGKEAGKIAESIIERLPNPDKDLLIKTFSERIGKGNSLHIRLSKQMAYLNKITLSNSDDVIKIVFKVDKRKRLIELKNIIKSYMTGQAN
ncbi:MAG: hypothetical protein G5Z42_04650 [Caldisphaeraceae archaeon]|nr:hypothetical protein [Caldisphaeraceae archaeon]MEB3692391.1 hypothetical protein [Caldisphaeraceae archaeon]MEB3798095.1 hypothetical protein [Caldisphaeraceae archaeon]